MKTIFSDLEVDITHNEIVPASGVLMTLVDTIFFFLTRLESRT